jgi:hypothetical protein
MFESKYPFSQAFARLLSVPAPELKFAVPHKSSHCYKNEHNITVLTATLRRTEKREIFVIAIKLSVYNG